VSEHNECPASPWRLAELFDKWSIMEDRKPVAVDMVLRERDVPVIRRLVECRNLVSGAQTEQEAEVSSLRLQNAELSRALRNAERPFVLVNGVPSARLVALAGGTAALVAVVLAFAFGVWLISLPVPTSEKLVAGGVLLVEMVASYLAGFWRRGGTK
jgi:hypothetical protein